METKKCPHCKEHKLLSRFSKDKGRTDGLCYTCKECRKKEAINYRHTKKGLVFKIHHDQIYHSKKRGYGTPSYTKVELLEFALNSTNFNIIFNEWVMSGYGYWLVPTFDRKDDYKGYSFDNFNDWMTFKDNKARYHSNAKSGENTKMSKAVIMVDKNITYLSTKDASRKTGINQSNICQCCLGKRKLAGGHTWKYV